MTRDLDLLNAWRSILPASVQLEAGPQTEGPGWLTAREIESVGGVSAQRLSEFASGRTYAKRALAKFDLMQCEIPAMQNRIPEWPAGFVGCITHAGWREDGHVAAAVARSFEVNALGIDVECMESFDPLAAVFVMAPTERRQLMKLPARFRAAEACAIWCAKEASIKAARRNIDPITIEIQRDSGCDGFLAILHNGLDGENGGLVAWRGRTARAHGLVLAAVVRKHYAGTPSSIRRHTSDVEGGTSRCSA